MRCFEKISFEQFKKDINNNEKLYEEYILPTRSTINSAGYDFKAIESFTIKPNEIKKIPTGYKAKFNSNEMLMIVVRSSMGFNHNIRLCNQIGIIDSDYYNNVDNEGHIWVALQNEGEKDYVVIKDEAYVQGIFVKFLIVDNEEKIDSDRIGGFGSTNKE